MRKCLFLLVSCLLAHGLIAQTPEAAVPATTGADVPVRQVTLFSSGVGFFEHSGTIRGSGSTELRFKTGQINDILKSLVLQDEGGGKIGVVTYPSQDPLDKTLRSFAIDLSGNPALFQLLNQLRGARATVDFQTENVSGTILGVETRDKTIVGETPPMIFKTYLLNLVTAGGIHSIPLEDIRNIQLEDKQLQAELDKALEALAQARDQEKKPVTINFSGEGERKVRIGYVIETPIWKTSYRLVLGEDKKGKMQGWAIVENQTDSDWNNIMLSLVSGRPISFIQDLYQPLYIQRPTVEPELYSSLKPQTYTAGIAEEAKMPMASATPVMRKAQRLGREQMAMDGAAFGEPEEAVPGPPMDVTSSIASAAAAAEVGELFQYSIGSVTLPRQRSAMLPILNDDVGAERVSIYNRNVMATHPLNGVRLDNSTGKHFLQGPVTVFDEGGYAGDARINDVPPGQTRLLSYGIDLQVFVNADKNKQDESVVSARIVKGVLELTRKREFSQEYAAENKSDRGKVLVIEHPFRPGWKLTGETQPVETTDTLYRFQTEIAAGKKASLTVSEENVRSQSIAILPIDIGQLQIYARTGSIPADVKAALGKAIEMKRAMAETEEQINIRQNQISEITEEQKRIRENMRTVAQNSEYGTRLLKKLNDQETRIEGQQGEIEDLRKKLDTQRQELENYLSTLNVG